MAKSKKRKVKANGIKATLRPAGVLRSISIFPAHPERSVPLDRQHREPPHTRKGRPGSSRASPGPTGSHPLILYSVNGRVPQRRSRRRPAPPSGNWPAPPMSAVA